MALGFLSGILFSYHIHSNKESKKYENWSIKLIYSTLGLLTISQIALVAIMVTVNQDFEIVMNSAAKWMSHAELVGASWTDRWGSYHLWTWFTWLMTASIFFKLYNFDSKEEIDESRKYRFFELLLWGSIVILVLLVGQRPYRQASHGNSPIGLNPSLLSIWNFMHPPLAFASYTGFFISWVITSYFWLYSPEINDEFENSLLSIDRIITRITWILTSLVLTLGVIWSHEANWGGYWSWDSVIVISVILWLVSGYRLHLHEVGSNQALYNLLGIIGFPLVFLAAWLITGNILEGLHNYAGSSVAPLFLVLMIITLIPVFIGWKRHKWAPLSPIRVSGDVARPTGFNIGVLSFNFLILGNSSIISFQILNSYFNLNREFDNLYPVINTIGFFGITVGLIVDSVQHKYISKNQILIITIIGFGVSFVWFIQPAYHYISQEDKIIKTTSQILLVTLMISCILIITTSDYMKYKIGKPISPRRLVSHIAMLFSFLVIIANGAGPSTYTRDSPDPYILEINQSITTSNNVEVRLNSIGEIINSSRGITIRVNLEVFVNNHHYKRTITVIDQIGYSSYFQAAWVTLINGNEIFLNLKSGDPLRVRDDRFVGVHLIVEEYFMIQSIWIATILFAFIVFLPSKFISNRR